MCTNASFIFCIVPTPNVTVTTLDSQQVGDALSLECNVTTVRGITSSMDIVWITSDGIKRVNVSREILGNSVVLHSIYDGDGLLLNESDDGTTYQCSVEINTTPLVSAASTFKGESVYVKFILNHALYISVNIQSMEQQTFVGSPCNISCPIYASGALSFSFIWTGPNGVITDDGRQTVVTDISNDNTTSTSSVQFAYLREDDEGSYRCDVIFFGYKYNYSTSSSVELTNFSGMYVTVN